MFDDHATRVLIMGAGGRDFHNFNTAFRDRPEFQVVGFTATQIPGIAGRRYPPSLAGSLYSQGIPIFPEEELERLIQQEAIDTVYLAYSDISHVEVMHLASRVLAGGADFALLGPDRTMLPAELPVIAVCAVRTGAGKSPTSQWIVRWLRARGYRVAVLRHPMPYGDLERQAVQKFSTFEDLERAEVTIEEREEYEPYVRKGVPIYAGVDYAQILSQAQSDTQVVLWDGGNNDFPFIKPDLHLVILDPHRAGHELGYHPGEVNFRMADAYLLTKVDSATSEQIGQVCENIRSYRPNASIVMADLGLIVSDPMLIQGKRVVIVGDGPTLTHGGMGFGAGTLAANQQKAVIVDPSPYLAGDLRKTFEDFPNLRQEVPAMGYSATQVQDLEATLQNVPAEVIVDATPVDLCRLIKVNKPIVNVEYQFQEHGQSLTKILEQFEAQYLS
ncbi:MAG: cyclic 2,3-diphosphoglycerate synthase [Dehalococcoidia bacterium]